MLAAPAANSSSSGSSSSMSMPRTVMAEEGAEGGGGEAESMVRVKRGTDQVAITVSASALKDNFIVDFAALLREPHHLMGAVRVGQGRDGDNHGNSNSHNNYRNANANANANDDVGGNDASNGDDEDRDREGSNTAEDKGGATTTNVDEGERKRGDGQLKRQPAAEMEGQGRNRDQDQDPDPDQDREAEKGDNGKGGAGRRRRRRKDEGEEYDLDDPFIDDTELPSGGATLRDLLAMDIAEGDSDSMMAAAAIDGEGALPILRPDDFYVWRGPLPVRQVDPLWLERAMEAVAAARSGTKRGKKRRRNQSSTTTTSGRTPRTTAGKTKPRTKELESSSVGEREQGDHRQRRRRKGDDTGTSPKAKRARKEKATTTTTAKEKGPGKRLMTAKGGSPRTTGEGADGEPSVAKGKRSIMDRIAAMGDADDDEQMSEAITMPMPMPSVRSTEKGSRDGEAGKGTMIAAMTMATEGEGEGHEEGKRRERAEGAAEEERMRKRYDYTTPYLELEERLAMEAVKEIASRADFSDPKKFPSTLRPYVNEAIVCCLRRQERKDRLPESFFTALANILPFTSGSLEKLTYTKLITLYRDELALKVIPQMLDELRDEAHALAATTTITMTAAGEETVNNGTERSAVAAVTGGGGGEATGVSITDAVDESNGMATVAATATHGMRRFNEKIRQLLVDLVKCELDRQALDRLITVQVAGGRYASFSETSCRKAFYPRIAACWPGEGGVSGPSTVEVAREYTTARRRVELRLLKEHHIEVQPTLIPISRSGKGDPAGGAGNGGRSTEELSRVASQLDSQVDLPPPEGEREKEREEADAEAEADTAIETGDGEEAKGPAGMMMAAMAAPRTATSLVGGGGEVSATIVSVTDNVGSAAARYLQVVPPMSALPPALPASSSSSSFLETVINETPMDATKSPSDPDSRS